MSTRSGGAEVRVWEGEAHFNTRAPVLCASIVHAEKYWCEQYLLLQSCTVEEGTEITVNSKGHPETEAHVVRLCIRLVHKNIVTVRIENYRLAGIGQVVSRLLREVI